MIIGNPYQVAIQIEQLDYLCSPSGIFNFIINDELIPGKGLTIDLYVVISSLKESLESGINKGVFDVGSVRIEDMDFSEGEPDNIISLNVAELYDFGCNFWLGFDGDEDIFIYTLDFEKSFYESRYPRGTIENLIRKLPLADSLIMEKRDGFILTTLRDPLI